jgi:hypothetical protein
LKARTSRYMEECEIARSQYFGLPVGKKPQPLDADWGRRCAAASPGQFLQGDDIDRAPHLIWGYIQLERKWATGLARLAAKMQGAALKQTAAEEAGKRRLADHYERELCDMERAQKRQQRYSAYAASGHEQMALYLESRHLKYDHVLAMQGGISDAELREVTHMAVADDGDEKDDEDKAAEERKMASGAEEPAVVAERVPLPTALYQAEQAAAAADTAAVAVAMPPPKAWRGAALRRKRVDQALAVAMSPETGPGVGSASTSPASSTPVGSAPASPMVLALGRAAGKRKRQRAGRQQQQQRRRQLNDEVRMLSNSIAQLGAAESPALKAAANAMAARITATLGKLAEMDEESDDDQVEKKSKAG